MSARTDRALGLLRIVAKLVAIFVTIVLVFSLAMDRGPDGAAVVAAPDGQVIEAPHQPKRATAALAAAGGIPAGGLRR